MKTTSVLAAIAVSLGAATVAVADNGVNRLNVPRDQWLSPAQVTEKLTAAGYTVRKIETDDGVYEVEMTGQNGSKVEAHVHPGSGEILTGHSDDD